MDAGQQILKLRKGQLLFKEGDRSRSMYLLRSGMVRLFLKRGESTIEIDTIRAGQILGELAFLDGNPRSVSGEALSDCELAEISGPTFMEVLGKAPEWLKILLKTVVGRLRAANTRIKQLESTSTTIDYAGKKGTFQFLNTIELMKASTAILLAGARSKAKTDQGILLDLGAVNRYSHNVMNVALAKTSGVVDVLSQCGILSVQESQGAQKVVLTNIDLLEALIIFLNEENLLEASKRHEVSRRSYDIMNVISKHLPHIKKTEKDGITTINLAEVRDKEKASVGKEPFRNEEMGELVKVGYLTELKIKSDAEVWTTLNPNDFPKNTKFMQVLLALKALNEQKRQVSGGKAAA